MPETPQQIRHTRGFRAAFIRIPESDPRPFSGLAREAFQLPVLLETVPVTGEGAQQDYMSIGRGEFSQAATGPKLRIVTLQTLTVVGAWAPEGPGFPYYYTADPTFEVPSHADLRWRLEQLRDSRTPFRIHLFDVVARITFLLMDATLRSVERQARGKEADTWYWTIQLKEWRRALVGRRAHRWRTRKRAITKPQFATLRASDTLNSLAREWYGIEGRRTAAVIAEANGIGPRFGHNTPIVKYKGKDRRFKVGDKVGIPALESFLHS